MRTGRNDAECRRRCGGARNRPFPPMLRPEAPSVLFLKLIPTQPGL